MASSPHIAPYIGGTEPCYSSFDPEGDTDKKVGVEMLGERLKRMKARQSGLRPPPVQSGHKATPNPVRDEPETPVFLGRVGVLPPEPDSDNVVVSDTKATSSLAVASAALAPEPIRYRRSESLANFIAQAPDETATALDLWRWRIAVFIESNAMRGIIVTAIITNSIIVGFYANGHIADDMYDGMDTVFAVFFCSEIGLKLFGFGPKIYFSDAWNVYDFVIVSFAVIEDIISSFDLDTTVARMIRVLRVFRFFRLVAAFQSLNKLVVALYVSVLEVAWVGVLATLLLYMAACILTTSVGGDEYLNTELPTATYEYFGTVQRSMLTLLQIMTTDSWCSTILRTFINVSPMLSALIVIFMIFSALILMNLLAAIYVDKLMQLTNEEKTKAQELIETKKGALMDKMKHIFLDFDGDGNGVLTIEEVQQGVTALDMNADGSVDASELAVTFAEAGLQQADIDDLMSYLATLSSSALEGDKEINYETFIEGIFSMHNPSTRKDTLEILSEVKNSMTDARGFGLRLTSVETSIQKLDKKTDLILQELQRIQSVNL